MAGAIVKRPPHLGTLASRCTMGFHVRHGNDEQFLTSGHCSYEQRSDAWYFPGTPEYQPENFLGDMQQTLYGTTDPGPVNPVSTSRDVMRVQMPDDQVSDDIYAVTSDISGYLNTAQIYNGLPVCKSGITTYVTCGTIYKKFHSYTSSSCGCLNFGTRATIKADLGDSGAPVYHQVIFGGQIEGTYAVGIQATRSSKVTRRSNFVRIQDALSGLNVTLVT